MLILSSKSRVAAPPVTGSYPVWRQGLSLGWNSISNTSPFATMSNVYPRDRIFSVYNGMANDRVNNISWSAGGGGHDECDGTYVAKFDYMVDAPSWLMVDDHAEKTGFAGPPAIYYPDGLVVGAHTYWATQVPHIAGVPTIVRAYNGALGLAGDTNPHVDAWHSGTGWELNGGSWPAGSVLSDIRDVTCALDERDGKIWAARNGSIEVLNTTTKAHSTITTGAALNASGEWGGVIIPARNEFFYGKSLSQCVGVNVTTNAINVYSYTWTNAHSIPVGFRWHGTTIDEANNKMYGIWEIHYFSVLDLTTMEMTYLGTPPEGVAVPWMGLQGVYNRICCFPDLGGIAYWPDYYTDMQFYATEM